MRKLMLILLGIVTGMLIIAGPLTCTGYANPTAPANIAEVANETHPFPPMNEVQKGSESGQSQPPADFLRRNAGIPARPSSSALMGYLAKLLAIDLASSQVYQLIDI